MTFIFISLFLLSQLHLTVNLMNTNNSLPITNVVIKPATPLNLYPDSIKIAKIDAQESKSVKFSITPSCLEHPVRVVLKVLSEGRLIAIKEVTISPSKNYTPTYVSPTIGRNFRLLCPMPPKTPLYVNVYNKIGQKVFEKKYEWNNHPFNINLKYLPPGNYFLELKANTFRDIKKITVY